MAPVLDATAHPPALPTTNLIKKRKRIAEIANQLDVLNMLVKRRRLSSMGQPAQQVQNSSQAGLRRNFNRQPRNRSQTPHFYQRAKQDYKGRRPRDYSHPSAQFTSPMYGHNIYSRPQIPQQHPIPSTQIPPDNSCSYGYYTTNPSHFPFTFNTSPAIQPSLTSECSSRSSNSSSPASLPSTIPDYCTSEYHVIQTNTSSPASTTSEEYGYFTADYLKSQSNVIPLITTSSYTPEYLQTTSPPATQEITQSPKSPKANSNDEQISLYAADDLDEPTKKKTTKVPGDALCGKCSKNFRGSEAYPIFCVDKCQTWYHMKCLNMTNMVYEFFVNSDSDWTCRDCRRIFP